MPRITCLPLAVLVAAACGNGDGSVQAGQPTGADSVAMAYETFDPAMFDGVRWEADSVALNRGQFVFGAGCAGCHGPDGHGDGGFVTEAGDTLQPPAFNRADFSMRGNVPAIRRKVFAGNADGMPHWGLRHMSARDIDAVARWIDHLAGTE